MPLRRPRRAVAAAAALLAGGALAGCGDDDPVEAVARERAAQAREVAAEAGLSEEVADLLADLAAGVSATYRVTYDVVPTGSPPGTLTVVQDPPRRRVEVSLPGSPDRVVVETGERTVTCLASGTDSWSCTDQEPAPPVAAFAEPDVARTVAALGEATGSYDLAVERREIAGVDGRCLVTTLKPGADDRDGALGAAATLCVSDDGVLLLAERPAGTLRATEVTGDVPEGSFDPPG